MSKKEDKKVVELITKATAAIVLDDPFYGYLLLRQEIVPTYEVSTAMTNGVQIKYNPDFIRTLTIPQIKGLLKHEVMHIAHMHHLRRQNRNPRKWNEAGDYVINNLLKDIGTDLPSGGLLNEAYKGFSTEHVYNLLPDFPDAPDNQGWNWGGVEDAPGSENESIRTQMEEDCKIDLLQAYNTAKLMGKLPAGIERLVENIRESKMPWRKILARFFCSTAKSDYSWLRPNRRFLAHGIYLPSLYSETIGPIVIGVDTSGSITNPELEQFFGCINSILRQTKPEAVHIVYCDAEVNNTQVFRTDQYPIKFSQFKPKGGGGTSFKPVFEYIEQKNLKPIVLIYLTDMYGTFPDKAPKYPVIWCTTSKEKAPFGKTLELK